MTPPTTDPTFDAEPVGETLLLLRFGERIDRTVNDRVHAVAHRLRQVEMPGLLDLIPAYASLALHYDAAFWARHDGCPAWQHLAATVRTVLDASPAIDQASTRTIEIPVCYGGAHGVDLAQVAAHTGLDAEAVIARHTAAHYRVAMLGFAPGFPYLLGLDARLHLPRRAQPRLRVPAGSVAIGGAQTGIYPRELPGGWQLIGRTPLRLFDVHAQPPSLLQSGDCVRFRAIDEDEFTARLAESAA